MDDQLKGSGPTLKADGKPVKRSRRGFACMDPARVRELARLGGKSAHRRGKAHEFTPEEARVAGRKGGLASHKSRPSDSEPPPESEDNSA